MSMNSFGHLFRVTTWGESHGPALGATVDGCPPGVPVTPEMIQHWLDKRKPGQNKYTTQRREADEVRILSGVFEGVTTGTPIQLMIENTDQRSKDYGDIKDKFRPGHADITYFQKYGIRDYRGGGRSSARETASRVAAGGLAREAIKAIAPDIQITGYMVQMGTHKTDVRDMDQIEQNPFWVPDAEAAETWAAYLDGLRKSGSSVGAIIEVTARNVPAGIGAPVYGKLDTDLAAAMMSINAVKGVEIGEGMSAAMLTGELNADEIFIGPDHHQTGRRDRNHHQGPPRPLCGHPCSARGRGNDGLRDPGSPSVAPRADRHQSRHHRPAVVAWQRSRISLPDRPSALHSKSWRSCCLSACPPSSRPPQTTCRPVRRCSSARSLPYLSS